MKIAKRDLDERMWYRLGKVLYITSISFLIILPIIGCINEIFTEPFKIIDSDKSSIRCLETETIGRSLKNANIYIHEIDKLKSDFISPYNRREWLDICTNKLGIEYSGKIRELSGYKIDLVYKYNPQFIYLPLFLICWLVALYLIHTLLKHSFLYIVCGKSYFNDNFFIKIIISYFRSEK